MEKPHLIRELGGAKAVADALKERGVNVAEVTVRSWTLSNRAIPAKYWAHIKAIADKRGRSLSFESLAQQVAA